MKKLYKFQRHSLYELSKLTNINIRRLYRYADGTVSIEKIPIDVLIKIAEAEELDTDVLYRMMKDYQERTN